MDVMAATNREFKHPTKNKPFVKRTTGTHSQFQNLSTCTENNVIFHKTKKMNANENKLQIIHNFTVY